MAQKRCDDDLVVPFPRLVVWLLAGMGWLVLIGIVEVLQWMGLL
jgi:hypothetical protein